MTEQVKPLSTEEQLFITAFRTGNLDVMKAMMRKQARLLNIETSEPEAQPDQSRELDVAEQLAMFIIGSLALRYPEIAPLVANTNESVNYVWEDVANAIKNGLPHLDILAFQRLHEDAQA